MEITREDLAKFVADGSIKVVLLLVNTKKKHQPTMLQEFLWD
jgi:hypothetical protein